MKRNHATGELVHRYRTAGVAGSDRGHDGSMDPVRILSETVGFFTRAQAEDGGYSEVRIAQMVRQRHWTRFRRGYYCFTDVWTAMSDVERHLVRCAAVIDSLGADRVALSHVSGVVAHGIDTWDVDLSRVHVTRLDGGAGRLEGDVVHHEGVVKAHEVTFVNGLPVLPAIRCCLEAGSRSDGETALCLLDNGLYRKLFDRDQLRAQFARMEHWPGMRRLHIPVRMADGDAASVGESRGRWLFWLHGLPAPLLQYDVVDVDGVLIGTTDWAWPQLKLLGEFDGRVKYGRLLKPGQEPGDVVFAEKQREDAMRRATGFTMERVVWTDYERPRLLVGRLRRAMGLEAG